MKRKYRVVERASGNYGVQWKWLWWWLPAEMNEYSTEDEALYTCMPLGGTANRGSDGALYVNP
jgi:hypothetical protein